MAWYTERYKAQPEGYRVEQNHLERTVLPARWLVVVVIVVGLVLTAWDESRGAIAVLVLVAVLYNLLVSIWMGRGRPTEVLSLVSPIVHGGLSVLGLLATGGIHSPFHPLLAVTLVAISVRRSRKQAIILAVGLIAMFLLGCWVILEQKLPGAMLVFAGLNLVVVMMVGTLFDQISLQRMVFIQAAAHELRNPMAGIKGLLSLVRRKVKQGDTGEDVVRMMEAMDGEINRLSNILAEFLDAFRAQANQMPLRMSVIDVSELLNAVIEPFAAGDEFGRFSVQRLSHGSVPVRGDWLRLSEVVANLISNAVKYSSPEKTIEVTLGIEGNQAVLRVTDQGQGIPRNELNRIFEPLYRASNVRDNPQTGGMGLGLYIAKHIVEQHGGRIWAESVPGVGTTFYVHIPVAPS